MTYDRDPMRRYNLSARAEMEDAEGWRDVIDEIPWLQFPEDWKVRVIPPFGEPWLGSGWSIHMGRTSVFMPTSILA